MKSIHGENLCDSCIHAIYDEANTYRGCELNYPENSYEDHWGDIIDCPEHEREHDAVSN